MMFKERGDSDLVECARPLSVDEVDRRVKKIDNNSSPGIDRINKNELLGKEKLKLLASLYNAILQFVVIPSAWKEHRTVLISKQERELNKAENWRPITIGSMVMRVFTGIISDQLQDKIQLAKEQKGLQGEESTASNCFLLHEGLKRAKRCGGTFCFLYIRKAFDTVPHIGIVQALEKRGVPASLLRLIERLYSGNSTCMEGYDVSLKIQRGVKQGDPLSPLLFNVVLDELLCRLEDLTGRFGISEITMGEMAYADDLVLVYETPEAMQEALEVVDKFLASLEMSLSLHKCIAFQIKPGGPGFLVYLD